VPVAAAALRPAPGVGAAPRWLGEPLAGAASGAEPQSAHRAYYSAVDLGPRGIVRVGDCVELAALPGEAGPRVARVERLWAERSASGRPPAPLASVRRFFRPEETPFPVAGALPQLFSSGLLEERVALAAVLRRVRVAGSAAGGSDSGPDSGAGGSAPAFEARFWYDHERGQLSATAPP
jgi:hypothetical protein